MKAFTHLSDQPVKVSVAFDYRGFVVSVSNIFQPNEIAIWQGSIGNPEERGAITGGPMFNERWPATIEGIAEAKEFIDSYCLNEERSHDGRETETDEESLTIAAYTGPDGEAWERFDTPE